MSVGSAVGTGPAAPLYLLRGPQRYMVVAGSMWTPLVCKLTAMYVLHPTVLYCTELHCKLTAVFVLDPTALQPCCTMDIGHWTLDSASAVSVAYTFTDTALRPLHALLPLTHCP